MELIFMGTGTSQGVPMIAYDKHQCDLSDPRNHRTRTSAHVVMDGHHIQIDAGPEFRMQCLANDIRQIDTFILTHGHADHLLGMDDLRRFCDQRGGDALDVYTSEEGEERVRAVYPYAVGRRRDSKVMQHSGCTACPTFWSFPGEWSGPACFRMVRSQCWDWSSRKNQVADDWRITPIAKA